MNDNKVNRGRSVMHKLGQTVRRKYDRMNKKMEERNSNNEDNFMEYIKEHHKDGLEERKLARMKKRETKLNMMNDEMIKQERIISSFRKHITMRDTKSIKYKRTEEDENSVGSAESKDSADKNDPLEIYIDGPFGSPSSNIYRAEHAVLIGTGIGITPFASILQSIMHR